MKVTALIQFLFDQGLSVAYFDKHQERYENVIADTKNGHILICNGNPSKFSYLHMNVLIIVNEEDFSEIELKEIRNIPSYLKGVYPTTIKLSLHESILN